MLKKCIFAMVAMLMVCGLVNSKDKLEYDVYGDVQLGYWWTKEYTQLNDEYKGKKDSILYGKDPYPVTYSDIIPGGVLGLTLTRYNLHLLFALSAKNCVYNFRYYSSQTSGNKFSISNTFLGHLSKLCGVWDINDNLGFLIGINRTPCNFAISNQMLFGGNSFSTSGVLEVGSRPMIQLSAKKELFSSLRIDVKAAVMRVDTTLIPVPCLRTKDTVVNSTTMAIVEFTSLSLSEKRWKKDVTIPKIEASLAMNYTRNIFEFNLQLAGGFQKYYMFRIPDLLGKFEERDDARGVIQSYILGAASDIKIGPVTVGYSCSGGQNPGIYGVSVGKVFNYNSKSDPDLEASFYPTPIDLGAKFPKNTIVNPSDIKNVKKTNNSHMLQMAIIGKFQPLKNLSFEGGYGNVTVNHEDSLQQILWVDSYAWYSQIQWTLKEVLTVTPEGGYYYYGPKKNQGSYTYFGLNVGYKF